MQAPSILKHFVISLQNYTNRNFRVGCKHGKYMLIPKNNRHTDIDKYPQGVYIQDTPCGYFDF